MLVVVSKPTGPVAIVEMVLCPKGGLVPGGPVGRTGPPMLPAKTTSDGPLTPPDPNPCE